MVAVMVWVSAMLELVVRVWAGGMSSLLFRILLMGSGVCGVDLKGVLWGSVARVLWGNVGVVVIVGRVGELLRVDVGCGSWVGIDSKGE